MNNQLKHIAFIMDGNGRWAQEQNIDRINGHERGAKQISAIIDGCIEREIHYMSFFAFSTENWKRPKSEIDMIIKLLKNYFMNKNLEWFDKRDIRVNLLGFENHLSKALMNNLKKFCKDTNKNKSFIVNIFFNYGSQQEILEACNKAVKLKKIQTIESFEKLLFTKDQPNVDLLIRTSGESRISNFLLWQSAYAEIIFEPSYWPAYTKEVLNKNIDDFYSRNRRYGGL